MGCPMTSSGTDAGAVRAIVRSYFQALETGDVAAIPYAADATFRAPLAAGGSDSPLLGREAIHAFLSTIVPRIEGVSITAILADGEWAAGRAILTLTDPAGAEIRTMNLFRIDGGLIHEQENHFDPRASLASGA